MQYFHTLPIQDLEAVKENLGPDAISDLEGRDILILGGEGALGTILRLFFLYLNETVYKTPCHIVSVDNFIGREQPKYIVDENLTNINQDLTLPLGDWAANYNFYLVLNQTGNAAPISGYSKFKKNVMDVSYLGTKYVLKLAKEHGSKLVCMSSSEVVGNVPKSELPSNEEIVPRLITTSQRSCYDLFKAAGIETQCYVWREEDGVDVRVIRPFNVQAYYRQGDSRIVCSFIDKLLHKQKLPVFKPSTQERTYCFYTDFIPALIKVGLYGKHFLYNIGSQNEPVTALGVAERLEKIAGLSGMIEITETPSVFTHEPQFRQPSVKRIEEEFGYTSKVSLDQILQKTWDWCKENYKY